MYIKKIGLGVIPALTLLLSSSVSNAADLVVMDEVPPATQDPWADAIISLSIGVGFPVSDDSDFDADAVFKIQGDARVRFGEADGLSLQLETLGSYAGLYDEDGDADSAYSAFQAGAHIFQRDSQSHALGGFLSFSGTSAIGDESNAGTLLAGVEVAQFVSNTTFVVQGGGAWDVLNDADSWDDGWFVRGVARYFVTPHDRLEAEVTYAGGSFDRSDEGDPHGLTWGLEYEHQVGLSPLSYFARYEGWHVDLDEPPEIELDVTDRGTEHAVMVGIRTRFGFVSLLDQDRRGAGTFDLLDTAPFAAVPDEL